MEQAKILVNNYFTDKPTHRAANHSLTLRRFNIVN